jgi:hypothetical protein
MNLVVASLFYSQSSDGQDLILVGLGYCFIIQLMSSSAVLLLGVFQWMHRVYNGYAFKI